jgi:hypothetical protein
MNEFINTLKLGFNLVLKPGENRVAAFAHAERMGWKMFILFLFPIIIFAALFSAYHYYIVDGPRIGILVWLSYILVYFITSGIFVYAAYLVTKAPKSFLYSMAYVISWICIGDILYAVSTMLLGIIGKYFLYLVFKLGAVWVANLAMNELIFAGFDLEIPKLKVLSTRMTLALVVIGLGIPYVIQMGIDLVVQRVIL